MKNQKRGKHFMALFLSALMLIQAPVASAAGASGAGQLEGLSGQGQPAGVGMQGGGQEEGLSGGQEDGAPAGIQRDATGGDSTVNEKDFVVDANGILTEYKGKGGEITIPAVVKGISVTGMKDKIFRENRSLTKVTILAEIEEIDREVFDTCVNLKEVVFPKSVKHIGWRAFYGCSQLEKVVFEEGLETIGNIAFAGCTSLKSIHIPLSVTDVSISAFESCTALESLTFQEGQPAAERKIGVGAFRGCTGLTEVVLPAGMRIEGGAFDGCTGITEFKVQEGSPYEVFDKCLYEKGRAKLVACPVVQETVTLPKEITAIGDRAFDGCTKITEVEIPDTVTEIGNYAFDGCSSLKKAVLPKNISQISDGLFRDAGITSIEIPETVTKIGSFAFWGCYGLKVVTFPGTVKYLDQYVFGFCGNLVGIYLQEGVERIGARAFEGCTSLRVLAIPKSVTDIDKEATIDGAEYYKDLMVYGETGSAAEAFAAQKGFPFSGGQCPSVDDLKKEIYDISNGTFTITLEQEEYDYDGAEKRPAVTVKKGETELMPAADFAVTYESNVNPGTAKAVVKGRGEYIGEVAKEFTIKGIDISGAGFTVTLNESTFTYDGTEKKPAVTVMKGTETLPSTNYAVKYENNIDPGTAKAIVTGTGIYAGTVEREFTIEQAPSGPQDPSGPSGPTDPTGPKDPKDISGAGFTVTLSETVYTYDGTPKQPAVTVMEGEKKLSGTSYTVKYENNTEPGTAKAIVTGAGSYTGTVTKTFTINPASGGKDTPSQEKKPIGLTCKKVFAKKYGDKSFSLQAKAVKGAKITYKSSDKKVADVDKKGKVTIKGTGIATITVKATVSGYEAKSLKVTVKVSPSKCSAPALKVLKGRKLKVSWKKDKRATGYQVQYCTSKAFKKGVKTVTVTKNKTVTKTIPRLAKGKRYYVRVRAYKSAKLNKKTQKIYGPWSSVKRSGKIGK